MLHSPIFCLFFFFHPIRFITRSKTVYIFIVNKCLKYDRVKRFIYENQQDGVFSFILKNNCCNIKTICNLMFHIPNYVEILKQFSKFFSLFVVLASFMYE